MGNAYSALQCEAWAKRHQAELLLRIEDLDVTRCRTDLSAQMIEDLTWLDIHFDGEVIYQEQRLHFYQDALNKLIELGVLYPCFCTRKKIQCRLKKQQLMPHAALDYYPYTCRALGAQEQKHRMLLQPFSWRLNQEKVEAILGKTLSWADVAQKEHIFVIKQVGDVIIGRKDITYSYHLSVVVDDFLQGITHVIRGEDLRSSTPVHKILQTLLAYPSPKYQHHELIVDECGQRLAKSKHSETLKSLRDAGFSAEYLREKLMKKGL